MATFCLPKAPGYFHRTAADHWPQSVLLWAWVQLSPVPSPPMGSFLWDLAKQVFVQMETAILKFRVFVFVKFCCLSWVLLSGFQAQESHSHFSPDCPQPSHLPNLPYLSVESSIELHSRLVCKSPASVICPWYTPGLLISLFLCMTSIALSPDHYLHVPFETNLCTHHSLQSLPVTSFMKCM